MNELINNQSIIIRPADKGSDVLILDRISYLKEGFKQLQNTKFYQHQELDLTSKHIEEINNVLEDMYQNGEIDDRTKAYLSSCQGRTSELYLLPKIHKPSFNKDNQPARPIMSANGSPTEKNIRICRFFSEPHYI